MPWVHFVAEAGTSLGRIEAHCGDNLLDLARLHEIPLHWRCGLGTCGTCRVHLRHAAQPGEITLSPRTLHVMQRAGLLPADAPPHQVDDAGLWRLACHLSVGEDDLTVIVPPPAS